MHCLRRVEELFVVPLPKGEDFFAICSPGSEELSEDAPRLSEAPRPLADPGSVVLALSVVLLRGDTEFFPYLLWLSQPLSPKRPTPLGSSFLTCCRPRPA